MTFLDRYVRTRGFTLGVPRTFTISPDGQRIVFLRSQAGDDAAGSLWEHDLTTGTERLVVDPATLPGRTTALADDERARAERMRVNTTGITEYATDGPVTRAVFATNGRAWLVDLATGDLAALPAPGPVIDPRLSPDGRLVAYVSGGALRVVGADGAGDRVVLSPEGPDVTYGLPEHVASESMGRYRGFWWSPDSVQLLVARVDNAPLETWYLSDPTDPTAAPTAVRYPVAGTANAIVTLHIVSTLDGSGAAVRWDRVGFEYVTAAGWDDAGPLIAVQNRAQSVLRVLTVDPGSGETDTAAENTDAAWTTIVPGLPARTAAGTLVWSADLDGTRRLVVGGAPVTPVGLNLHEVLGVDGDTVLFTATDEPTVLPLWTYSPTSGLSALTAGDGVYSGARAGGCTVIVRQALDQPGTTVTVQPATGAAQTIASQTIASRAEEPTRRPRVELSRVGELALRTALLYPTWHTPGDQLLPVLLDPYGGPATQRVLAATRPYLLSQWFADQGFAVVVIDGRGTPGRGPGWERTIHLDRSSFALDDQVTGLLAVAAANPDLDLTRVGIRGWSYGGYLAALAVLRRPDVFHVGVAGAPPTDQRLYDTHWQERFLGHPDEHPEAYDRSSLLDDAPSLRRPLMLIHGLRDDNVHAAHTLRLSAALLAAGRPHTVLPLGAASHMVHSPETQAQLFRLQVDFLHAALGGRVGPPDGRGSGVGE